MSRFVDRKIKQNYIFMTLLQVLNMCFYLLLYPYLIRVLGIEGYGLYAYATAIITLCITVVNYGFDLPGAKRIAEQTNNPAQLEAILSDIFSAKIILEAGCALVFGVLLWMVPEMSHHRLLYAIGFLQTLSFILFPIWYYQGVQRMKVVTYIQFGFKLLTIPGLLLWLHGPQDVWILMALNTASSLLGALVAWCMIRYVDRVHIHWAGCSRIRMAYHEATPFFVSNITSMIKEQGIVLLAGSYLGMHDVAIYDLANKLILIPRTIFMKLNDAIYPKMMVEGTAAAIRRILRVETVIGMGTILLVVLLGAPAVWLLGGTAMHASYYVAILLSITVLSWLVVGAMLQFCVIPSGKTYWVTINQAVATIVCLGVGSIGVSLWHNVYALSAGIVIAAITEMVFCRILIHKQKML